MRARVGAVVTVLVLLVAALVPGLAPMAARAAGAPAPLPPIPLNSVTAPGSVVAVGRDGTPRLYWVSSGNEAVLSITDARDGRLIDSKPLPGAGGSWALDALPNGDVWIASYGQARVFRYVAATEQLHDLGPASSEETFTWSITHDEAGTIFVGTGQIGGHVVSFDPVTLAKRDYGTFGAPERPTLLRSLAAGGGKIYAGTGAAPSLTVIDKATGARTPIALPDLAGQTYVYDLDLRGELLFVRVSTSGSPQPLFVYDTTAGRWIDRIPGVHGLRMSPVAPDGRTVYFVKDGALFAYDLVSRSYAPTGFAGVRDVRAFGFLDLGDPAKPGPSLVGADYQGSYFTYHLASRTGDFRSARVVGSPANVRSMTEGPDRRIYFSSYLGGDLAAYDPATGAMSYIADTPQFEGLTQHDGKVYGGGYPNGEIWQYDPAQPTAAGVNPKAVLRLYDEGQSRPWALTSAGRHLAIGTVPHNGEHGGQLTLFDTRTGEHWSERIAGGHSVVGLTYRDGVVYGSTSIYGGTGATRPTQTDGRVFAYDVATRSFRWEVSPRSGEGAYGELAFDKAGNLWVGSTTSLFRMDPATGAVRASRLYEPYPWSTVEYVWVASQLWIDPTDDKPYWLTQGAVYSVDPATMDRVRAFRPASFGLAANDGRDYLARDVRAWSWDPTGRPRTELSLSPAAPTRGEVVTVTATGLGAGETVAVFVRPQGRSLGEVTADATGTATLSLPLAMDAPLGALAVEIQRPLTRGILRATTTVADVRCDRTISGSAKNVVVSSGTTCAFGADLKGGVTVGDGARFVMRDSTLKGALSAARPGLVAVERSSIQGGVSINRAKGIVELTDSQVRGGLTLTNGALPAAAVVRTTIQGGLSCSGNAARPVLEGNAVKGERTGQCAG